MKVLQSYFEFSTGKKGKHSEGKGGGGSDFTWIIFELQSSMAMTLFGGGKVFKFNSNCLIQIQRWQK